MDHGHQGDFGESPGGQLEAASAGQLDGQCLEEELGQVLAQTGPYASSKGEVVEPAVLVFASPLPKAVGVKDVHVLEDRGSVMGVPDAVHHAPAFGDLETLQRRGKEWRENQSESTLLQRERENKIKQFCFVFFPFSLGLLLKCDTDLKENQKVQCKGLGDRNPGCIPASVPGTCWMFCCYLSALWSLAGVAYPGPRGAGLPPGKGEQLFLLPCTIQPSPEHPMALLIPPSVSPTHPTHMSGPGR